MEVDVVKHEKKKSVWTLDPYFTAPTKISLPWIINLNAKIKTIKQKNFQFLGVDKDFFKKGHKGTMQKIKKLKNWFHQM